MPELVYDESDSAFCEAIGGKPLMRGKCMTNEESSAILSKITKEKLPKEIPAGDQSNKFFVTDLPVADQRNRRTWLDD